MLLLQTRPDLRGLRQLLQPHIRQISKLQTRPDLRGLRQVSSLQKQK